MKKSCLLKFKIALTFILTTLAIFLNSPPALAEFELDPTITTSVSGGKEIRQASCNEPANARLVEWIRERRKCKYKCLDGFHQSGAGKNTLCVAGTKKSDSTWGRIKDLFNGGSDEPTSAERPSQDTAAVRDSRSKQEIWKDIKNLYDGSSEPSNESPVAATTPNTPNPTRHSGSPSRGSADSHTSPELPEGVIGFGPMGVPVTAQGEAQAELPEGVVGFGPMGVPITAQGQNEQDDSAVAETDSWENPLEKYSGNQYGEGSDLDAQVAADSEGPVEYKPENQVTADGPCKYGETIYGSSGQEHRTCAGTKKFIKTAETVDKAGQLAGAAAVTAQGLVGQFKAADSGKQSTVYESAASTTKTAGILGMVNGVANLFMGYKQKQRKDDHERQEEEFQKVRDASKNDGFLSQREVTPFSDSDGTQVGQDGYIGEVDNADQTVQKLGAATISAYQVNNVQTLRRTGHCSQHLAAIQAQQAAGQAIDPSLKAMAERCSTAIGTRKNQYRNKRTQMQREIGKLNASAASEQANVKDEAEAGMWASFTSGFQQLTTGLMNLKVAGDQKRLAGKLKDVENLSSPTIPGSDPLPDADDPPRGSPAIGDSGPVAGNDELTEEDMPDLGTGFAPDGYPDDVLPNDLKVGEFREHGIPNAGGGGGGGLPGLGSGGTRPDSGDQEAPKQQYAKLGGDGARYDSAGVMRRGGGAGARGGKSDGMDLSGLLAKFLPGKDDGKNTDILKVFKGKEKSRDLASMPHSLLGRNVNIFKRVSEAYQAKTKTKAVIY